MTGDGGGAMFILGFLVLMTCAIGVCALVCFALHCFGHGDADNSCRSCSPSRAQALARSNPYLQPAPPPQQVTIINNHYYAPQPAPQLIVPPPMREPVTPLRMPDTWPDGEPVEVWPDVEPARWPS